MMSRIQFGSFYNVRCYQVGPEGEAAEITGKDGLSEVGPRLVASGEPVGVFPVGGQLMMAIDDEHGPDHSRMRKAKRYAETPAPGKTYQEQLFAYLSGDGNQPGLIPASGELGTVHAYFNIQPGQPPVLTKMLLEEAGEAEAHPADEKAEHAEEAGGGLTPELAALASHIQRRDKAEQED